MKLFPTALLLLATLGVRAQQPTESAAVAAAAETAAETAAAQTGAAASAEAADLERLAADLAALRDRQDRRDRLAAALPRLSGYIQFRYDGSLGGDARTSSFSIQRVRLTLAGDICPRLDYRLQLELASPKIVDAYLDYHPFEQLKIRAGQYKVPFSIENTDYAPTRLEFTDYPLALQRLMGFSEQLGTATNRSSGRDMGLLLHGGFFRRDGYSILGYDLALLNGAGINTADNNRSKDLAARLTVKPLAGLLLSGSYYLGEYGAGHLRRIRYGAGAAYDRGPLVVRGEWIGGRTGTLESAGWYAMAGWRVIRPLTVAARYDTFRSDTGRADSRQTDYTAALTWQPLRLLRCQLDYTCERYAARGIADRHVVSVMLTGMF